jgi:membrane protease YdiL (CAAX protease family)
MLRPARRAADDAGPLTDMKDHNTVVDALRSDESPRSSEDATSPESVEQCRTLPVASGGMARQRLRVAGRTLGSLLLGGAAILGSVLVFRHGLLPLIHAVLEPGPETLSAFRRAGILMAAVAGYWAFVHWHEKRAATELRLLPVPLMLGGASGAALVALPIAALFALGAYELVLFRDASSALWGVAAVIGIAAVLEELFYRCLLFRLLERDWGTGVALAVQAVVFALLHLGNVGQGGTGDVVAMLVSVTLLGLLWAGVFVLTRNLWVTAAHHAAWNFTILLSGAPLSGIDDWRTLAPLESRYAGPDWLTGGMFGPESSLLVIVSTAVAVVLLLRAARRRGAFLVPTD